MKENIKNKLIQIRATEQQIAYIKLKMAENNYTNRSEYILDSAISPIKHNKKRSLQMIFEVNRIGVNLNQIVHKMHKENKFDESLLIEIENIKSSLLSVIETFKGV
jgi:hypothetical protein